MPAIDRDLIFINQLSRALDANGSPASILEEVFKMVFDERDGRSRVVNLGSPSESDERSLNRIIHAMTQVVSRYVQLYQNPHAIPVTLYQRQKKLAIHLDQQFSKMLWEKVRRANVPGLIEDGKPIRDSFLDEPILFMKEEARSKRFPKNKRGDISNIQVLIDRFQEKLTSKGIDLEDTQNQGDRFTYGP